MSETLETPDFIPEMEKNLPSAANVPESGQKAVGQKPGCSELAFSLRLFRHRRSEKVADSEQRADRSQRPFDMGMWPMIALGLVIAVDQLDQNILRGVLSQLKGEFALSDSALGWLTSAFIIVHALVTVPAGYVADRRVRRKTIGWTVVLWSLLTGATALSVTYWHLFTFRALLGLGQGITEPSASSLLADYYPPSKRGRAFSVQQNLFFIGAGTGLALGGAVGQTFGWRWAFVMAGIPGLIVASFVYRLKEPKRGMGDRIAVGAVKQFEEADESEVRPVFEEGVRRFFVLLAKGLSDDMKTILAIPTLRYSLVGVSALLFTVYGLSAWLPIFYQRYTGMSEAAAAALVGAMVTVGGVAGTLVGGNVADRYATRIKGGRVVIPAYCIFAATIVMFLSLPAVLDNRLVAIRVILQLGAIFFVTMAIPALRAGLSDAVPATLRGAGFAAFSLVAALSGSALAAPLIGQLTDLFNSAGALQFFSRLFGPSGWVARVIGLGVKESGLRLAFWVILPPVFLGSYVLYRARAHMDEDAAKILRAVAEAIQKQKAEEASLAQKRSAD